MKLAAIKNCLEYDEKRGRCRVKGSVTVCVDGGKSFTFRKVDHIAVYEDDDIIRFIVCESDVTKYHNIEMTKIVSIITEG